MLDSIIVHKKILHLIFNELDLKFGIGQSLIIEIDDFAHHISFNLLEWDELIFLVLFDLSEHLLQAQQIQRTLLEGEYNDLEHDEKEMLQGTFMLVG